MFHYEDVVLQESEIDTLRGPCYLTDKVIAFYFAYLSSAYKTDAVLLVEPSVSFWLAHCDQADVISYAESNKLSTKSLILFVVNDSDVISCEGDSGNHWSILVYHRSMNSFIHYDTMEGMNRLAPMKLYKVVKSHVGSGGQVSTSKKTKDKKKSAPDGLPVFREGKDIPQQSNGYDCGLSVLAIAKVIYHWLVHEINTQVDLLSAVARQVDHSAEFQMRVYVLGIIKKELGIGQ